MKKECINPKSLFNSIQFGFSQIVKSKPGKHVFISGQVAYDENLNVVGDLDLAKQTQKSIDNLKIAIEAAGGTIYDIVMLRIYKVNYQHEDSLIISQVLKDNFDIQNPPASTWLSVQGLANSKLLIEVEAQAII